ncbi:MAG: GntR family transcriptional regulator [Acidimicrobiia bacterium]|nr:GntR family transcriptional regulator [Acidimicrobiia bacterium]
MDERLATTGARPVRQASLAAQIEEIVGRRIAAGEFGPGDQLPSEHELADQLGVSRATIRIALAALARRGLLVSRQGVGTFVSEASRIANDLAAALDFHEVIRAGGAEPSVHFDAARLAPAGERAASALRVGTDDVVHRAAKRFAAAGVTVVYSLTSIPVAVLGPELAGRVEADPALSEPMFDFFERQVGQRTSYQLTSLRACSGREVDHPGSDLAPEAPVLEMDEVGFTTENLAIWHSINWYVPGSMAFQLVRRRPVAP